MGIQSDRQEMKGTLEFFFEDATDQKDPAVTVTLLLFNFELF